MALANTQFIESRVQEDNSETEASEENVKRNDQELSQSELISSICESIKQGLKMIDEKYEKVEVVTTDSDEDDNVVSRYEIIMKIWGHNKKICIRIY